MNKRILSILLALSMLLALAVLFASCGETDGHVKLKGDTEVDVSGWSVIYADSNAKTRTYRNTMTNFASALSDATGERFAARLDGAATLSADEPAILIGQTGQKESTKLKSSISGDGFAIEVYDNRIAIVGSSDIMTLYAVNYFVEKYLKKQNGTTTLTLPKKAMAEDLPMVTLATPEKNETTFIYSDGLYASKKHPVDLLVSVYASSDLRDTPVSVADTLIGHVSSATGLGKTKFKLKSDKIEVEGTEFLVSKTNRPFSTDCLQSLDVSEYGFFVQNGQFVLTAWSDAGLLAAQSDFADLLTEAGATQGKSKITVAFPEGFFYKGDVDKDWYMDFPRPDAQLYSSMDTGDDSVQLVYMGEGVSADTYNSYVTTLKNEGYKLITENTIEESLFATLVNEDAKHMLYVSYNAFAHESEYAHNYEPLMRVVSSPTASVAVPDASILSKQSYTKVCNTSVTAIELVGQAVGMGYIITLEDGSFVLFDGGNPASGSEDTNIWNLLNALYRENHGGKSPTADDPIRVAAWVVTHSHADHYNVFRKFLSNYGKRADFQMDYLIGNFPSASAVYCVYNTDIGMMGAEGAMKSLQNISNFTFLKVHSGQKYYFANLEMEVLMTYDDLAPAQIKNQNDTSTVLRFSMQATSDGKTAVGEPYVMIWTGDANNQQSRYMCAMYGEYLEADMVQVAHHGNIGCESDFYDTVKATVVWFPHSLQGYRSWLAAGGDKGNWVRQVDWKLVNQSEYTKYVFVSGGADSAGGKLGYNLTLPFGNDGQPAFDDIYNTLQGKEFKFEYTMNTQTGGVAIKPPQNWN